MDTAPERGAPGPAKTPRRTRTRVAAAALAVLVVGYGSYLVVTRVFAPAAPRPAAATSEASPARGTGGPSGQASPDAGTATFGSAAKPAPAASARSTRRPPPGSGPVPDGWPTADTTGWRHTGVTLTPYATSGEETVITRSGTVIDGADIRSRVRIAADNVTIRRSRITGTACGSSDGCYVLSIDNGRSGLLVEDVEVTRAPGVDGMDRAIVLAGGGGSHAAPRAVVRRAHVHATYRGVLVGHHTVIEESYIDDLDRKPPEGAHVAAITAHGGKDVVIRRNSVALPPNDASSGNLALYGDDGPLENLLIEDNLFNGGSSCLFLGTDFRRGPGTFITIRNNLFGVKYYGDCGSYYPVHINPRDAGGPNFTWSNNTWYAPGNAKHGKQVPSS
jgi:hypothetical protein